jgi:undecaprenyl-diphosphatase
LSRSRASARLAGLLIAWIVLVLVGWGLGELSSSAAQASDVDAVRDVAQGRSPLLTTLAHTLSFVGSGYVIVPLTVVVCVSFYHRGRRVDAYAVTLSALLAMALSSVTKIIVDRSRPPVHHLEVATSASFPSGHATQSAAFYVALLLALRAGKSRRVRTAAAIAAGVLIAAIATSRVYLGVHYPTDVVAGVLLGGAWSVITRRALCAWTGLVSRSPPARPDRTS